MKKAIIALLVVLLAIVCDSPVFAGEAVKADCSKIDYEKKFEPHFVPKFVRFLNCEGKLIKQFDMTCDRAYITKNNKYVAIDVLVTDTPEAAAIEIKRRKDCLEKFWAGGHYEVVLMDSSGNTLRQYIAYQLVVGKQLPTAN